MEEFSLACVQFFVLPAGGPFLLERPTLGTFKIFVIIPIFRNNTGSSCRQKPPANTILPRPKQEATCQSALCLETLTTSPVSVNVVFMFQICNGRQLNRRH